MKRKGVGMITKQKDLGEQMRGLEAVWGGEERRGSLVPFQTQGISTCHQNTLYCQT